MEFTDRSELTLRDRVTTTASSKVQSSGAPDWDRTMAEATAHLVSAYRAIEALSLQPSPFAATLSFGVASHNLCATLVAIDDCCTTVWSDPVGAIPIRVGPPSDIHG